MTHRCRRFAAVLLSASVFGSPAIPEVLPAVPESPDAVARVEKALAEARALNVAGDPQAAIRRYQRILRHEAALPAVPVSVRTRAYAGILETLPLYRNDRRGIQLGNRAASKLMAEEREALGTESADRVPGLVTAATWYRASAIKTSSGLLIRQRRHEWLAIEEALRVLAANYGERHASLAAPLLMLASSCVTGGVEPDLGRTALERALGLDIAGAPDAARLRAAIHAALGDHAVVFGPSGGSDAYYASAWRALAESAPDGVAQAVSTFGEPSPLRLVVPELFSEHVVVNGPRVSFAFEFTVKADGHIDDLVLLPGRWPVAKGHAFDRLLRSRYRPRIAGGVPIPAPGQRVELFLESQR